jgi:2-polyprenyl-3-methyl-5-hydroxy-6-metoxy-1,4-benzoquinol methylase
MYKKKFDLALNIGAKKLHSGRKNFVKATEIYHKLWCDSKGNIKKKFLEKRKCPLCYKENYKFLFFKSGGKYVRCLKCNLVFLNPSFKDKYLEKYYKNMHTMQAHTVKKESDFYNMIYNFGLTAINKFSSNKKEKKILDIGCSSGYFLNIAKKNSWRTYGVELNEKEIKEAIKNHYVVNENFFNLKDRFNFKFDAITMWDVIEHIKDCNKLLQNLRKILNYGGIFFFQTPNVDSLAARILQEKCNVFDGFEHVNLFNERNILMLAKKNNFKVISIESVISEIPIINNYLNYENPYFGKNNEKNIIKNTITEKQLHDKFLGYKIQVIFKKIS